MTNAYLRQLIEKLKFPPLEGFPDPDRIVTKKLQEKALRLIPFYNDRKKRFWISFCIGFVSPVMIMIGVVLYCQIFNSKGVFFSKHLSEANELILWLMFMFAVGYVANEAFELYCRNLFQTIEFLYLKKTGKTAKEFEEALLKEFKEEMPIAYWKAKKGELNRQKYKAYVCYAFYGLIIPTRPKRHIKVPIED